MTRRVARRLTAAAVTGGAMVAAGVLVGCGADEPGAQARPHPTPSAESPSGTP